MSQKVSSILFNNYIYNNSKWFVKSNPKFSLNEDLQIREVCNLIFKSNIIKQFLFIVKIVTYKYHTKIKIYIYFFCNFNYFKQNICLTRKNIDNNYLTISYLYYKYREILQIKKLEIIKILRNLINSNINIFVTFKNINFNYNNIYLINNNTLPNLKINNSIKYNYINYLSNYKRFNINTNNFNNTYIKYLSHKVIKKNVTIGNNLSINSSRTMRKYSNIKYFKTLRYILYVLAYNDRFITKLNANSLLNIIYYELNSLDNTAKNYNFLFYNLFNIIREQLLFYFKDNNCKIKGIRIMVKGRYFLTKRKRVFIFNLGNLNLNKINYNKDYHCLNLIKSTGSSSLKIWISYKN